MDREKLARVSERARYIRNLIGRGLVATTLALGSNPQILPQNAEAADCAQTQDYSAGFIINGDTLGITGLIQAKNNKPTQFQLQLVAKDGPGLDIYLGDSSLIAKSLIEGPVRYEYPAPVVTQSSVSGSLFMLPRMQYLIRKRYSVENRALNPKNDDGWCPWIERPFDTDEYKLSSEGINAIIPSANSTINSLNPRLQWANMDPHIFYYEVQLSKDYNFETDPNKATASIYSNLIHGGLTTPPDSYQIPTNAPLELDSVYYWRVRPRVQGDGVPVAWSSLFTFKTAANARLTSESPVDIANDILPSIEIATAMNSLDSFKSEIIGEKVAVIAGRKPNRAERRHSVKVI